MEIGVNWDMVIVLFSLTNVTSLSSHFQHNIDDFDNTDGAPILKMTWQQDVDFVEEGRFERCLHETSTLVTRQTIF